MVEKRIEVKDLIEQMRAELKAEREAEKKEEPKKLRMISADVKIKSRKKKGKK